MEWIKDWTDSDRHPQMVAAGFWGREVFRALCRLSGRFDLNGSVPTGYLRPQFLAGLLGIEETFEAPIEAGLDPMALDVTGVTEASRGVTACFAVGLLVKQSDGSTVIPGWVNRQERSLTSAERSRKYRESKKLPNAASRDGRDDDVTIVTLEREREREKEEEREKDKKLKTRAADAAALDLVVEVVASVPANDEADALVSLWNETAAPELPRVELLTQDRRKAAKAALDKVPLGKWPKIIAQLNGWNFAHGHNDRGWKADFDWLLARDKNRAWNYLALFEGAKGAKPKPRAAPVDVRRGSLREEDQGWATEFDEKGEPVKASGYEQ